MDGVVDHTVKKEFRICALSAYSLCVDGAGPRILGAASLGYPSETGHDLHPAPQCEGSFTIYVTDFYKTTPITIFIERVTDPYIPYGWLFDGMPDTPSKVGDWQSTVTALFASPWEYPGQYQVKIYAYPSSMSLDEGRAYNVYAPVTFVVEATGIKTCSAGTTSTYTTIDMTHPTTRTMQTYTWTHGTTTYDWHDWWWNWDWWRWWWVGTTGEPFDFALNATPAKQSMKAGQSASFTVAVKLISGTAQPVILSLSDLPAGMSYSFSLESADPTFTSALLILSQAPLSPGTYTLTIIGSGGGKTHSITLNLIVSENKQSSSLSLSISPPSLNVGESVTVGGALAPGLETTIELVYTRPDGFELTKHVATSGAFSDAFKPDMPGPWSVKARWPGDADHYASESQPASFSVEGTPETSKPFWEQIPPLVVIAAILAILVAVAMVLVKHRSASRTTPLITAGKYCGNCGLAVQEGRGFCTNCGEKLR